jgi:predicted ester cyclase
VVTRLIGRGTFLGDFQGISANGKVIEITGITIHRVVDGKLVEHWANIDGLGFLQQLGALPAPAETTEEAAA